jgi:hypothetical protein
MVLYRCSKREHTTDSKKKTSEISKEISKKRLTNQTDCGIIKMFQRERKKS